MISAPQVRAHYGNSCCSLVYVYTPRAHAAWKSWLMTISRVQIKSWRVPAKSRQITFCQPAHADACFFSVSEFSSLRGSLMPDVLHVLIYDGQMLPGDPIKYMYKIKSLIYWGINLRMRWVDDFNHYNYGCISIASIKSDDKRVEEWGLKFLIMHGNVNWGYIHLYSSLIKENI